MGPTNLFYPSESADVSIIGGSDVEVGFKKEKDAKKSPPQLKKKANKGDALLTALQHNAEQRAKQTESLISAISGVGGASSTVASSTALEEQLHKQEEGLKHLDAKVEGIETSIGGLQTSIGAVMELLKQIHGK